MANSSIPTPAADDVVANDPSTSMQGSTPMDTQGQNLNTPYAYPEDNQEKDTKSPEEDFLEILKRMFGCADTETSPTKSMENNTQYAQVAKQKNQQAQPQATADLDADAEAGASLAAAL